MELAAVYGRVETFDLLTATLEIDSNSDWFQLAQVGDVGLFYQQYWTNIIEMAHFKAWPQLHLVSMGSFLVTPID